MPGGRPEIIILKVKSCKCRLRFKFFSRISFISMNRTLAFLKPTLKIKSSFPILKAIYPWWIISPCQSPKTFPVSHLSRFEFMYLCGYCINTFFLPPVLWSLTTQGGHRLSVIKCEWTTQADKGFLDWTPALWLITPRLLLPERSKVFEHEKKYSCLFTIPPLLFLKEIQFFKLT